MAHGRSRRSLVTCLGLVAVLTLPLSTSHAWSIECSRKLEPDARMNGVASDSSGAGLAVAARGGFLRQFSFTGDRLWSR